MIAPIHGSAATPCSTPEQLERMLNSTDAIRAMPPEVRRRALQKLADLKRTLQQTACSASWFAECWSTGTAFPPLAPTTPMIICRCERCIRQGRLWPANYSAPPDSPAATAQRAPAAEGESGSQSSIISYECHLESLDDWTAAQLPSSPSGLALRAIREGRIKLRRVRTKLGRRKNSAGG